MFTVQRKLILVLFNVSVGWLLQLHLFKLYSATPGGKVLLFVDGNLVDAV